MENFSESRNLYSWWWDSHISPRNSKWLQENLTDMDSKVKAMIKLIEEDADSFARRAEMYYKKRPELLTLVEDFYRAYRALAERHDHLTGELRQAHCTIAEAFPNLVVNEDPPSRSSALDADPHTTEVPQPSHTLLSQEHTFPSLAEFDSCSSKSDLKQIQEVIGDKETTEEKYEYWTRKSLQAEAEFQSLKAEAFQLPNENENLKALSCLECQHAVKAECQIYDLQRGHVDTKAEKESLYLQHQICVKKLSNMEIELSQAENESRRLSEQTVQAQIEVQTMKQALTRLELEKEAPLAKGKESMELLGDLEGMISHAKENLEGLAIGVVKAENEAQYLNHEFATIDSETKAGLQTYNICLEKISYLEGKIPMAEENVRILKQQADRAKNEVLTLGESHAELNEEKESSLLQYTSYLKKASKLETVLSCPGEQVQKLNSGILGEAFEHTNAEQKYSPLRTSSQSPPQEVDGLARQIVLKDQELFSKQEELEDFQVEHLCCSQIEAMLQTLISTQSQAQEDHKALALELKAELEMLKRLELCKCELENEIRHVKVENQSLRDEKMAATMSIDNLQNEILCLRKIKARLEEEAAQQNVQTNSLQTEISSITKEMEGLNNGYQCLVQKLESAGLNTDMIWSSIKCLQVENSRLRQDREMESTEKQVLSKKLEDMEELSKKKDVLESSLSQLHGELEASHKEVKELQDKSQFLRGACSVLITEKAAILAQLQTLTENMQKVFNKNAVLQNSLSGARIELEGLKEKSKSLEEICHVLKNEKFILLTQKGTLVVQLANAEGRSGYLENRLAWFEENYADLKKENETMQSEVEELTLSLSSEKHERINSTRQYETGFISMEHHIHLLQEENRRKKKEYEDEINKSIRAQLELFILQKFLQDMEDKNYSLLTEHQKHVEASKFAEKLISELRNEKVEQQVEAAMLQDETERLRFGLYHVFKACIPGSDSGFEDKIENEQILVHEVIRNIDNIKQSATKHKDDIELLKVENLILFTLIHQMQKEGVKIESKKDIMKQDLNLSTDKVLKQQHDKYRLVEMNDLLKSQVDKGIHEITLLQVGTEILCVKQGEVEKANLDLQEKYFSLRQKCSGREEENCMVKSENDVLLHEIFALLVVTTFLESFASEKILESKELCEGMYHLTRIRDGLEKDMNTLKEKLEMKEEENICLKDLVHRFEMELQGVKDVLRRREVELLEAEERFKAEKCTNFDLSKTLVEVKDEIEGSLAVKENLENHVLKLSEVKRIQQKEIEELLEMNANLMSELCKLHEVCEVHRNKEENLRTELKAKNNEFELCKGEATALYHDLQISSIQGVLYENMVRELAEMCGSLEDQTYSRTLEIQELIEKMSLMNTEIGELKAELSAYAPVIASLRDYVTSLEHNTLRQLKLEVPDTLETKCAEAMVDASISCQYKALDDQFCMPDGIEALQKLQSRIRTLEKALVEEIKKLVINENLKSKGRRETALDEIHEIVPEASLYSRRFKEKEDLGINLKNNIKLKNAKPEASTSIKDILLDQVSDSSSYRWCKRATAPIERADDKMLELWEAAENSCLKQGARVRKKPSFAASKRHLLPDPLESARWKIEHHPSTIFEVETELSADKLDIQEVNNRKIHDRIASNARKLTSLQLIIENLNRKLEAKKKSCKSKDVDLEMVEQQLQEVQESVFQLKEFNGQFNTNVDDNSSYSECQLSGKREEAASLRRKRALVQARKGSETIGQLQIEVQKLESMLSKLENGMKSKGRSRFSRNRTTIILRDVIYNGKNTGKKKKAHMCGCFRPTSNRDTRRM